MPDVDNGACASADRPHPSSSAGLEDAFTVTLGVLRKQREEQADLVTQLTVQVTLLNRQIADQQKSLISLQEKLEISLRNEMLLLDAARLRRDSELEYPRNISLLARISIRQVIRRLFSVTLQPLLGLKTPSR